MHIISEANCEDKSWRGRIIHRGELVTSVAHLKRDTGITTQSIRTCLERLKSTNEITTSTTNRFTLITVIEYEKYQENQKKNKPNNKPTNKQLTNNQQQLKNIEEDKTEYWLGTTSLGKKVLITNKQNTTHIPCNYQMTFEELYAAKLAFDLLGLKSLTLVKGNKDD